MEKLILNMFQVFSVAGCCNGGLQGKLPTKVVLGKTAAFAKRLAIDFVVVGPEQPSQGSDECRKLGYLPLGRVKGG